MIRHITYCNELMTVSAGKSHLTALNHGATESRIYTREDIPSRINEKYKDHFCDYWAWKPYIIFNEIHSMPEGSYLVYSDAGIAFTDNMRHVIDRMGDEDVFLFSNGFKNAEWTKGDVYNALGVEMGDHKQVQASLMFFRVGITSLRFVAQWFALSLVEGLIDDSPSITPNYPTFAAHRHDQSLIGTLAIKHNIKLHWYPVTTAHHIKQEYDDQYPEIAWHHRKRNNEW